MTFILREIMRASAASFVHFNDTSNGTDDEQNFWKHSGPLNGTVSNVTCSYTHYARIHSIIKGIHTGCPPFPQIDILNVTMMVIKKKADCWLLGRYQQERTDGRSEGFRFHEKADMTVSEGTYVYTYTCMSVRVWKLAASRNNARRARVFPLAFMGCPLPFHNDRPQAAPPPPFPRMCRVHSW